MFKLATENGRSHGLAQRLHADGDSRRGSALLSTVVIMVSLMGLIFAASSMSAVEVKESRRSMNDVKTKYLAQAGVERGMNFLSLAVKNTKVHDPLSGLKSLFAGGNVTTPIIGEPVMDGASRTGAYTISLTALEQTATSITIAIDASGYYPDVPSALPPGRQVESWHAVRSTVRYSLAPSEVFNYAYFINNWGWFYGNTIICKGNARSNGQFDAAGYSPTVTGQPMYDSVSWNGVTAALAGYHDDNLDGLKDGNDGGIFSGWDIVGAQNVQGNGGQSRNQHDFDGQVEMPNLADLKQYEDSAIALGSNITIDGVTVCDGIQGDGVGEKQNLFLIGTAAKPIVLNGPVVVRGNVMISGVVTGKGAIYSGGNVYIPNSVSYKNAPITPRPVSNTQAATEAWLSTNWNKDFLGLFARENVVVGDTSHSTWQYYTGWWMGDPLNMSSEDAGEDGIPNTRAGRDGILGTADDDVLEGDGVFTIERYTAADAALGLIPPGKSIGDTINGTGEDIDGDGVYDPSTTLSDVVMNIPLNTANWAGNMPAAGYSAYNKIATLYASRLDATFYTNHSFCYVVLGSTAASINGAVVSRNEDIIYGTPSITINHDSRLLGSSSSPAANLLPRLIRPPETLRWTTLDRDPNRLSSEAGHAVYAGAASP
ncbi:MAG: hypothetical protein JNL28_12115 [Planctomycetes bacterium]|nr:hypothetical protein [Planctomycetota bacterium]